MYDAFRTKRDISHLSALGRYTTYVRAKWPYVLHHVVLFTCGYTLVVVSFMYLGDTEHQDTLTGHTDARTH